VTSRFRRQVLSGLAVFVALTQTTCFRFGPAEPAITDVTLTLVTGDGQFGPPSQFLIDSLTVVVRTEDGDLPADGVLVDWEIAEGPVSAQLSPQTSSSDSTGLARAQLRLGSALGRYVIRASIRNIPRESVDFEAWAVLPPTLSALSSSALNAGALITLTGTNFSTIATHNVVLFSGIPGQVISGDAVRLDVIVPPCLPTRSVDVLVQLGGAVSGSLPLSVTASAEVLNLALGADTVLSVEDTPVCLKVGSGGPQEYLAVVQSTATIGAARFDYTLTGLRPGVPAPVALRPDRAPLSRVGEHAAPGVGIRRGPSLNAAQAEWDLVLREREDVLLGAASTTARAARTTPEAVPNIGDLRDFDVVRADGGFDEVTARVRFVSQRAILYEDTIALGSLDQTDIESFADLFDDPIYPVDTGAFGSPSDLDGNDRVIILFTPSVNRLSPPGSNDLIGGFFFGLDLLPGEEHSNAGEVFYVLVPDPTGVYGNVRTVDLVRSTVPPILAHEFQHMIHHNERIIEREASTREAIWLAEGLAHMAEDLVGEELRTRGRMAEADEYQRGNRSRASLFLTEPSEVSLIIAAGQGSLAERGAAWLFLEYLRGQAGNDSVLGLLTGATETGTANVESVTGRAWAALFSDWSAALELERQVSLRGPLPLRNELLFLGFDLMDALDMGGEGFPSMPTLHESGDFSDQGRLWSSSGAYFLIVTGDGGLALSPSGLNGGPVSSNSGLRLKLVRLL
jgi:hypothetical protein